MRSTSCTLIFFLTFISTMEAQNFEIYSSDNIHKTHQQYHAEEKHTDGNEVRSIKVTRTDNKATRSVLLKDEQKFLKMIQYQNILISLGYDLKVTGTTDKKALKALHNYLSKQHFAHTS